MEIFITDEIKHKALRATKQFRESPYDKTTHGYNEPGSDYGGLLGEYVFDSFLKNAGIKYEFSENREKPDKWDFKIPLLVPSGVFIATVDVKTGTKETDEYMAMFRTQPTKCHIYVGVQLLNDRSAKVWGWARNTEIKPITDKPMKEPSKGVRYSQLNDLSELIERGIR